MVSTGGMAGIVTGLALSVLFPIVVFLVCRKRMTLSWRNIAVGAVTFVVFALVLEQLLHRYMLQTNPVTVAWFSASPWNYVIYAIAAAALFEEVGRYVAMRLLVKDTGTPGTPVAYGIGHGGIEAWILGAFAQFQFLVAALMLNQGKLETALSGSVPPARLAMVRHQLETVGFFDAAYGGVERVIAVLAQIGFSLLVWKAVSEGKIVWLFVAMAAHATLDVAPAMVQAGLLQMFPMQLILIAQGLLLVAVYLWALQKKRAAEPA